MVSNNNEETKGLLTPYPNVRRVMISSQTFTLEEIHQAIQNWIEDLRKKGDIASLARIKYATMNPDTAQQVLLKLVRLAIGECANERIRNEVMTNIAWPISFTQDLLGLLTAIDYDISAVEETSDIGAIETLPTISLGESIYKAFQANDYSGLAAAAFMTDMPYNDVHEDIRKLFEDLANEIIDDKSFVTNSDDYEF